MQQEQLETHRPQAQPKITTVTEHRPSLIEIDALESRDAMTGLLDRAGIQAAYKTAAATNAHVIAVHLDLEGFQTINHHHGFDQGDQVLCVIAERLAAALPDTAAVARVCGDELMIVAHGDRAHGEYLAARLLAEVDEPIPLSDGGQVTVNARAGWLAVTADPDLDALRHATFALHEAKVTGIRVAEYADKLAARVAKRRQTEIELRTAAVHEQLTLHGQSVIDVFERRTSAIELKLRWKHPQAGWLQPNQFLPIAEECGVIDDIDKWVVRQFVEFAVLTHPTLHFAVNLSMQTISKPASLRYITEMLGRAGVPTGRMHVILTPSDLVLGSASLLTATKELADAGVHIAINNFGGGYSSLAALTDLSITTLKLDKSLAAAVDTPTGSGIVKALVGFASARNIDLMATGVATVEQAEILRDLGCRFQQGNVYQPAADLEAVLNEVGTGPLPAAPTVRP